MRLLLLLLFSLRLEAMVIDPVDPAFGVAVAEFATTPNGAQAQIFGFAGAPRGRVAVLTAQKDEPSCFDAAIVMFGPDGTIDRTFGANGRAPGAMLGLPACASPHALAVAPDGAIFIVAVEYQQPPRVWKARPDGTAAPGFGVGGSASLPGVESVWRATLQALPDGAIAVGGTGRLTGTETWGLAVIRLQANGLPDTSYGKGGIAFATPANRPIFMLSGAGMAVNADGSALVMGNIFEDDGGARTYTDATVARFDARGALDVTYGDAGFAIPLRDASTYAQSLAVRDGIAYLAGIQNRDVKSVFVARIDAGGHLDLRYGAAGIASSDSFYETDFDPIVAVDDAHRVYYLVTDLHLVPRVTRLAANGVPDPSFGLDGSAFPAASDWNFAGRTFTLLDDEGRLLVAADGLTPRDGSQRSTIGVTRLTQGGGHRDGVTGGTAIVFYNAALDHYFMTADRAEQALLDNGITAGWRRTGEDLRVVTSAALDPELSPVCRYYGRPEAHLDSHFFSAAPDECAAVAQRFGASWTLETSQAFQVHLPDRVTGACPRGSLKVVRAFDNRPDANHYYGWLAPAPPGWIYEGYGAGPYPTAFCAPLL